MKTGLIRFAGIAGTVIFLFGVIGAFVVGFQSTAAVLPIAQMVIGLGAVIAWFLGYGLAQWRATAGRPHAHGIRFGAAAVVSTVLFVGILALVNYLGVRHDKRWDLTEEGVYSIAEQSKNIVANLKAPLKMVVFKTANGPDPDSIRDLLDLYASAGNGKFSFEIIDPQSKPHLVEKYGMKTGNFIYLEYGDTEPKAVSRINEFKEEAITNAILKLTRGVEKKIYYVQGHGEPDIKSNKPGGFEQFASAMSDEQLKLEPLTLATAGKVPDDAAALILNSPKKPLLPQEKELLLKYGDEGGRLLVTYDPRLSTPEVREIAQHFGATIGEDVVVDMVQRLFGGSPLQPIIPLNGAHKILERFSDQDLAIFNLASTVSVDSANAEAVKNCQELLKSGPQSWAEKNLAGVFDQEQGTAAKDPEDVAGPVPVAVVCEKKFEKKPDEQGPEKVSRVIVVGDSDWFANGNLQNYSAKDLVLNMLNWLSGEEGGVSIRPRQIRFSAAPIRPDQWVKIFMGSYLLPELLLLAGLFVWWRRRSV